MRWSCGYGHYEATTEGLTYVVSKQWRRGEPFWLALVQTEEGPHVEVPGTLPLTRREAMANCERHAQAVVK